jgi:hypothetical protein
MLTDVLPPRTIPPARGQRRRKKVFNITELPRDVFILLIKDHLTIIDRIAFSLACKSFAEKMFCFPSTLQLPAPNEEQYSEQITFFFRNVMRDWFPADLKFCQICGRYVPMDRSYWIETLARECAGRGGKLARNFFAWTASTDQRNSMAHHYRVWEEEPRSRTCPRCKLHTRHL